MLGLPAALGHPGDVDDGLLAKLGSPLLREAHALDLLRRPELSYDDLNHVAPWATMTPLPAADSGAQRDGHSRANAPGSVWRDDEPLAEQVKMQVDIQAKYSGYLKRQSDEIERQQRHEELRLPENIDYGDVSGLSNEARERLREVRPETLGQAARIPGLTPAAVSLLLVHLKKRDRAA